MGLQVWLPLTDGIENQGLNGDIVPQYMGTGVTFTNGKIGNAATFLNNCSSCIYMDGLKLQTGSWCAWIKVFGEGSSSSQWIISEGRDCGSVGTNIFVNKAGTILTAYTHKCALQTTISLNTWYHVAITFGDGVFKLYVDGNLISSVSYTEDSDYAQSNDKLVLGKMAFSYSNTSVYFPFNGQINDFRAYDTVLSPREVKEISKGLVLHYPLAMPGQENIIANTSHEIVCTYPASGVKDYYSVKTKSVPNETQYTLSFEARSTVDGDHLRTHFYSPNTTTTCESSQGIIKTASDGNMDFTLTTEWRRYWVVYTQTETTAIKSVICPRLCSPASYPSSQSGTGTVYVRNQKLEHGSHPTPWIPNPTDAEYSALGFNDGIEYDVSGYGHNGTKVGTITYDADTPRYEMSTVLDGSYITLTGITDSAIPQFSICGWVNLLTGYTVNYGCHLINFDKTYCRICISKDGAAVRLLLTDGTTNYSRSSAMRASGLSTNVWNHYAITFDNGSIKIYINGELDSSMTAPITSILPSASWTIGNHGTTEIPKAKVSDVRFYTTALSADDIKTLYQIPISLSNNGTLFAGEFVGG